MNNDTMNLISSLAQRVADLENYVSSRKRQQISYPLDSVSQTVVSGYLSALTASSKSATSENQTVNEAGSSTYDVLKPPVAFIQANIGGTTRYIPVY